MKAKKPTKKEPNTGGWHTCSRGHKYRGKGPCPKCYPGSKTRHNA